MRTRIFMVDDESDLVWTVSRHFRRARPDYEFRGFSDPIKALQAINEDPPHFLITDLRMQGLDGLELVQVARERSPDLLVLVVTAYGTPEVHARARELGALAVVEKPFDHRDLLQTVDQALVRLTRFSGQVSLPLLSDLIQMLAMSQRDGALSVTQGDESGQLWFSGGRVVHCTFGEHVGREAFRHLLRLQRGKFQTHYEVTPPETTIEESLDLLLLESARQNDEEARATGTLSGSLALLLERAELWQSVPADERPVGAQPFLALSSIDEGQAIVLISEADREVDWIGSWVDGVIDAARALDSEETRGSVEWLEGETSWIVLWNVSLGLTVIYREAVTRDWRASDFRARAARLTKLLLGGAR